MSPPFPFKKDNTFVLSDQEKLLRFEVFKVRETVKLRSLRKLASRGGMFCLFCNHEENDTMIECDGTGCENVIHKSCFELTDGDRKLISGWIEVVDEQSSGDNGVNLVFCKECSFQT